MKKLLLLILFLIPTILLTKGSLYRTYQTEDGLSHNSVWSVMQDSKGYMWFGTNDGLNRFDGLNFKVFRREDGDTLSLGNNFIHCLLESPDGKIFVGTKEGLYSLNPSTEKFKHIVLDGQPYGKDRNSVHQLLYDKSGNMWIGCYGQGIYRMSPSGKMTHYTEPALPSRFVTAMTLDNQGNLYVGTDNAGLYRFDTSKAKAYPTSITKANVQTLLNQNNNTIWVGTLSDGLYHYDNRSDSFTRATARDKNIVHDIKALTPFGTNQMIMGSEDGLLKLDCNAETLVPFGNTEAFDNLPDKSIFSITVDSEGSIWLGTYFYGVSYWSPRLNAFSYYPVSNKNATAANLIRQFSVAPDGNIIMSSRNDGVSIYDVANHSVRKMPLSGVSDNVQFAIPVDNQLWISDYDNGLVLMSYPDGRILKSYNTSDGLPSNVVNTLYRTSRNETYVGTARGGARYNGTGFVRIPELQNASVMTIVEDYSGNIWFATHFHGLFKMSPSGKFTNYSTSTGALPGNNINNIVLDSHGKIWVGTEGEGLALFNPATGATEKRFSQRTGLPSDIIYSSEEDQDGNIWVSTGGGLVKIAAADHSITNFRYLDNLLKIHYNHNSSVYSPKINNLFFGGSSGFITFNPNDIKANTTVPIVRIVDFTVNGNHRALPEDGLVLESNEATFGLDLACLSYLSPEQNVISYMLEGYDNDWKTLTGNERHIEYMNLPWGNYTLLIKGANNDGVWSEPISMDVKVNRPLLLSNAMIIVYILLIICAIWLIKRRLEYLQRRKMVKFSHAKEKELYEAKIGFFTNIAHEIRTPLSLISAPLETVLASGDGNERTRHNLQVMQSNVDRLLELINQLLDFRKVEAQLMKMNFRNCNVSKIVLGICERYEEFARLHSIKIDTKGVGTDIYCNLDLEAFEKIVGNLMSNATKFANKSIKVSLSTTGDDKEIILKVIDDGPGIKEKDITRVFESFYQVDDHGKHPGTGLGLPLALRLAQMHNGTLSVESEYGKGCEFILTIPMTNEMTADSSLEESSSNPVEAEDSTLGQVVANNEKAVILVVEDNNELRSFIADNLSDTYQVMTASNGVEAFKIIEKKPIDLIVSDIMMPDMDGIELCRAIRTNMAFAHLPIILLSAKTDIETKVEGLNIGADAYIEKPFSIEQLRAQIKSILEARRRLQENLMKSPLEFYKQQHTEDIHETESVEFVNRFNDLIISNLNNSDFNVDTAAREFAMSRSSFHSKVKNITGETPNNYIRVVRLCKAAEFLASGKYQIVEVCYMVGFNTPSYFSKCFAEHFGMLPKDYILEITKKEQDKEK